MTSLEAEMATRRSVPTVTDQQTAMWGCVQVNGVHPTADVPLSGLQDAARVEQAIACVVEQGHRVIGIGRHCPIAVAQTAHTHRIQLPDNVILVGGDVHNGLWHLGNDCRIAGGRWVRDDPEASDATIFRVGDVHDPREDVAFEEVSTRIADGAGASVYPYDIRNGERVRVEHCDHISEVSGRLTSGGGAGSGQGFCVGAGGREVTVRGNVAQCDVRAPDDFVNFSSMFRRSGRIRVLDNTVRGFENLAAAADCDGMYVAGNTGENVRRLFMGKAAWFSARPSTVSAISLAHNQLFDQDGAQWRQVAMLLAGAGGVIDDVMVDGCQVHGTPGLPGTNMIEVITRSDGVIRYLRATNINVTTEARLERLLSTRGPGEMRDLELYDWRVVSGGVGQLFDLQGGLVPGTFYQHNVRVVSYPEQMATEPSI